MGGVDKGPISTPHNHSHTCTIDGDGHIVDPVPVVGDGGWGDGQRVAVVLSIRVVAVPNSWPELRVQIGILPQLKLAALDLKAGESRLWESRG